MNEVDSRGFVVCHTTRGRLRVKVASIRSSEERAVLLERWLAQQAEVQRVEAHPTTGSVILLYEPKTTQPGTILRVLAEALKLYQSIPCDRPAPRQVYPVSHQTGPLGSIARRVAGVIALTGFLVYALVRKLIVKSPLSEAPFGLLGAVATAGAIPLLRRARQD